MKFNKIILSALMLLGLQSFALQAKVMGHYQGDVGQSSILFQQLELEKNFTLSAYFDVEAKNDHHRVLNIKLNREQYNQVFESDRDLKIDLEDANKERPFNVTAMTRDGVRTIYMVNEMYNENVHLGTKEVTFIVEQGKISAAKVVVKKKKTVGFFITLPGKFDSVDATINFTQQVEGLGLTRLSVLDRGYAISDEAIDGALQRGAVLQNFCEYQCNF